MPVLCNARRVVAASIGLVASVALSLGAAAAKESAISLADLGNAVRAAPFSLPHMEAPAAEPFGLAVSAPIKGALLEKWNGVRKAMPHEASIVSRCRQNAEACTPAAKRFIAVVDKAVSKEGWTQIAEINRTINLTVRAVDDQTQYGVRDLWASPLMMFASGAGDCEDLAIAKYVALREIGIREENLRLVIVRDHAANEDHAVTAIRHGEQWFILDNKRLDIREDINIAEFDPLFVIEGDNLKRAEARLPKPQRSWMDSSIIDGDLRTGRVAQPLL